AQVVPVTEASAPLPADWFPPSRIGQLCLVSGSVDLRVSSESAWAAAELNQPIFSGEALRTDLRGRGEIRIGANTIDLSNGSELEIVTLRDGVTQIRVSQGRIGLVLRQAGETESVEIDVPGGGVWLLGPGKYDIDVGEGNRPVRVAAFDGTAQ